MTVKYLENNVTFLKILPFLKQWQPDIIIDSPKELKDILVSDLKQSILLHES